MQVSMSNGKQNRIIHELPIDNREHSYFRSELRKWENKKEKRSDVNDEEFKKLRSRYETSSMNEKEKVDYLGSLVKQGAITTTEASDIYYNIHFVPLDPNFRGGLTKDEMITPSQRNLMSPGNTSGNWLEQYRTLFDYMLGEQNLSVDGKSSTIQSYEEYSNILARMSKYKAVGEV